MILEDFRFNNDWVKDQYKVYIEDRLRNNRPINAIEFASICINKVKLYVSIITMKDSPEIIAKINNPNKKRRKMKK